jgi:diaminohydroxyphosphoribosylaminopyrimidine deaminase / 5-amino-6-(5-phosphoribosylamino)uracil reductase
MTSVQASVFSAIDHLHMAHALRLAERGLYTTQPNPRVGCVIARGESVLGEGFHARAGEPHAEVFALREAGNSARGATAYVTLEPCAHHGRTPPCANALVDAGVARVVIAAEDTFPKVNGRGIGILREAGIVVDTGLMRQESRELNIGFFSRIERGRPWIRVKLAMSLDGRTAMHDGESKWITGDAARQDVQRWRARSSAILTGRGTVVADNPRLTVRLPEGEAFTPPMRVVLDRRLWVQPEANVVDGSAPTWLLHGRKRSPHGPLYGDSVGYAAVKQWGDQLDLNDVVRWLTAHDCNEIHVEAGANLCGSLFFAGLVDELLLYIAPVLLGSSARPLMDLHLSDMASRWKLQTMDRRQVGEDTRLRLRPVGPVGP